jgi:hypothetical protein
MGKHSQRSDIIRSPQQIIVFRTHEDCIYALLNLESAIEVHEFRQDYGRVIRVAAEDATLLQLAYPHLIEYTMPFGKAK